MRETIGRKGKIYSIYYDDARYKCSINGMDINEFDSLRDARIYMHKAMQSENPGCPAWVVQIYGAR